MRHPSYGMEDRLLLDKIDYADQSITIKGMKYHLEDCDFPTVDRADPYKLTPEEESVIDQLTASFLHSEKLQRHVRFLYSKGSLYKIHNGNLLFHGCIPLNADGSFMTFSTAIVQNMDHRMLVDETDIGRQRKEQIADLRLLLEAFRSGAILEDHGKSTKDT